MHDRWRNEVAVAKLKSFIKQCLRAGRMIVTGEVSNLYADNRKLQGDCQAVTKDLYALNDRYQEALISLHKYEDDLKLLDLLSDKETLFLLDLMKRSKSQLRQEIFVLSELRFKKHGFFVEFGACDGVDLSNTLMLENEFGWSGILAEPARIWHEALLKNRKCHIETKCVWRNSGENVPFNEVSVSGLSTIASLSGDDLHKEARKNGLIYDVETISLVDMLDKYQAPREIDYLSIDTEGSEYDIFEAFDFEKYRFRVITCEHNYAPRRDDIYRILIKNGYIRKFEEVSKFDDWYVRAP